MKTKLGRLRIEVDGDIVTVRSYRRAEKRRYLPVAKILLDRKHLRAEMLDPANCAKLGLPVPRP